MVKAALAADDMKEITSGENRTYKTLQKLSQRKYRDRLGLYLIEGANLVEEALKSGAHIEFAAVRRDAEKTLPAELSAAASAGTELAGAENFFLLEEKLFDRLAQTESSQGVLAAVRKPGGGDALSELPKVEGNAVALDRLQDPGNIGTIIRTAEAAGYEAVIVLKGTADVYSPKTVRAAAGSLFRMKILTAEGSEELVEACNAAGKRLVASCMDGEADYAEADLADGLVLAVGNEGSGLCPRLLQAADLRVRIPMAGKTESLNAAVAAALLMYEARRKNENNNK